MEKFYQVCYGRNSGSKKNFETLEEAIKFNDVKNGEVWEQTKGLKRQTPQTQKMLIGKASSYIEA